MEQYGYWGNKGNAFLFAIPASGYGDWCCKHCDMRASFDFFTLLEEKKKMRVIRKILDRLEEILIRFRENKFDDLLKTEKSCRTGKKLNDPLEAIGHHIQLLKEEARTEKESTKEMVSDISHQLKTPVAALDICF